MKPHSGKAVRWLYEELPSWVREGLITEPTAARIRERYPVAESRRIDVLLLTFGTLGCVAVGAGIILLLAHNWAELSRTMRTVVSFVPLVASQGLTGYVLARRNESRVWREGVAALFLLSIGACNALISQTYHCEGTFGGFLFAWLLLGFPVVYLLRSSAAAVLYLAGIAAWSCFEGFGHGATVWFWLFAGLIAPFLWQTIRTSPNTGTVLLLEWAIYVALAIGVAPVVHQHSSRGLWIPAYAGLMATFVLGGLRLRSVPGTPFIQGGGLGVAVVSLLFTYSDIWHTGWMQAATLEWQTLSVLVLPAALQVAAFLLLAEQARERNWMNVLWGIGSPLAIFCYLLHFLGNSAPVIQLVFNAYLFVLGIGMLFDARQAFSQSKANIGLVILSAVLVARFFDADMSFTVRGLGMIAMGVAFLVANLYFARIARVEEGDLSCAQD